MATITGTPFDDVDLAKLDGTAGADKLKGLAGNDELSGNNGDDTLIGGAGADYLNGGAGSDTASYVDAPPVQGGLLCAYLSLNLGFGSDAEGDRFFNIENLTGSGYGDALAGDGHANRLEGLAGADQLTGMGGADKLFGGNGDDLLFGGNGKDELTGGQGADYFYFFGDDGRDLIKDFSQGQHDKIALEIDCAFIGSKGFTGAHQIRAFHDDGNTVVQMNNEGDLAADVTFELQGKLTLKQGDFILLDA